MTQYKTFREAVRVPTCAQRTKVNSLKWVYQKIEGFWCDAFTHYGIDDIRNFKSFYDMKLDDIAKEKSPVFNRVGDFTSYCSKWILRWFSDYLPSDHPARSTIYDILNAHFVTVQCASYMLEISLELWYANAPSESFDSAPWYKIFENHNVDIDELYSLIDTVWNSKFE